jgi:NADPH-dependent 2,4-dienoyl-CoA reductase/sulfur reductase-like enzyme
MMLEKVYREGDKLVAVLENEYTGAKEERVVDQVVVENGVRPDEAIYYALKEGSRNKGQIDVEALFAIKPQPCLSETGDGYLLFRIGDCVAQRNTHAAIYDALRLCKDF